ncbi:D-alanyl-D-alanine carboxypeptidase family protein [Gorillibacterium sp. CAU 1737]|uniref:D-alanyl-D-alanine carboxypeptidase family protein n=1 Tax=Gorillibacterium sp. CAU 1737 TaxID=3140362 RepID=UPI003260E1FB
MIRKVLRRACLLLGGMALLTSVLSPVYAEPAAGSKKPPALDTQAETAALIDVTSGRLLYSKQGDKRMRIASTTKIMTAILAVEYGHLSDKVTVTSNASGKEGSSIYLKAGEEMSLNDLLYGLMLRSGNDAATAIAEHVGGSQEGFVYLMNQKAEELGMVGSHFANPSGLDAEDHYSTAHDMAKLAAYALKNPLFREIVKTKSKRISREDEPWDTVWTNKNKMLSLYPGSDGVKTGFTKLSRRCLVSSATRNGQQLAAVTLNDGNDWADHSRMLDYGFVNYPLEVVVQAGEKVGEGFAASEEFAYPLTKGEAADIRRTLQPAAVKSLEYRLGKRGDLVLHLNGERIGQVSLKELPKPKIQSSSGTKGSFANEDVGESNGSSEAKDNSWMNRFRIAFTDVWSALIPGERKK